MAQDLSQSLYQDLYAQCGNDEAAARAMYQNFIHDKEAERRRTLQEAAQTFPSLPERVIVEILDSCQWSLELACAPLVAAVERIEEQERYRREEERRQRYLRAQDLAIRNLHSALTPNNKEELRQLLEDNEGDVEATVELFVQQVLAVRRVEEHDRELERKQRIINALMDSGLEGILRADVEAELQKCNWDFNLASVNLLRLSEQRKIAHLQRICSMAGASFPVERLERALNENSWNVGRAREALLREVAEQPASVPAVPDFMTRSIHIANEVKRVLESEQNGSERAMMDALADVIRTNPADIGLKRAPGLAVAPSLRKEAPPVVEEEVAKSALAADRPTVESQVLGTPAQPQTIALHLSDTRVDKSQTLQVSWQVPDNYTVSNRDWIGLYTIADQAERSYLTYQWVVPATPTVSFSMSKLAYGEYICRYFSATQKGCVGSSPSFSVGPLFALTPVLSNNETNQVVLKIEKKFGDNPSSRAWVGLYYIEPGQVVPNQNYITYQRLGSLDKGLIFDITKAGEWEFRLFPENTYVAAACCPITIAGEDQLTLTLKGTQIEIQVDLQTKDVATDAPWIGVYKVEEKNIRMYRRYKYLSANGKSTIVFKAPIHTGNYHARLLAGNSDTVLATSNSILIEGI